MKPIILVCLLLACGAALPVAAETHRPQPRRPRRSAASTATVIPA